MKQKSAEQTKAESGLDKQLFRLKIKNIVSILRLE